MTTRTILTVAVAAAVAAGGASAGTSTAVVVHRCGTLAAAGKTWRVSAAGVSCAAARAGVRKLAPKAARVGVSHGTYLGMSCLIATKAGKAGIISVGSHGRKSVQATAP